MNASLSSVVAKSRDELAQLRSDHPQAQLVTLLNMLKFVSLGYFLGLLVLFFDDFNSIWQTLFFWATFLGHLEIYFDILNSVRIKLSILDNFLSYL